MIIVLHSFTYTQSRILPGQAVHADAAMRCCGPFLPLDTSRTLLLPDRALATLTTPVHDKSTCTNQTNTCKATDHDTCDGTSGQATAALSRRSCSRARARCGCRSRLAATTLVGAGLGRVEAHGRARAKVGDGADVRDVGAGVKGLVFGLVKVCNVLDLPGSVAASAHRRRGVGHVDARVTKVHLAKGVGADDLDKVIVALGVFLILSALCRYFGRELLTRLVRDAQLNVVGLVLGDKGHFAISCMLLDKVKQMSTQLSYS